MDEILKLTGVAAIKEDSQLTGNEIVIVPLSAGVIAPIVGGLSVPSHLRVRVQQRLHLAHRGAMGLMVKQDINNKYSVIHASS